LTGRLRQRGVLIATLTIFWNCNLGADTEISTGTSAKAEFCHGSFPISTEAATRGSCCADNDQFGGICSKEV
jgi:hypothetical protein